MNYKVVAAMVAAIAQPLAWCALFIYLRSHAADGSEKTALAISCTLSMALCVVCCIEVAQYYSRKP